nr:hypothetical protein [Pseudomonas jinjuensis]
MRNADQGRAGHVVSDKEAVTMQKSTEAAQRGSGNGSHSWQLRGTRYAIQRSREEAPDPGRILDIPCADSFSVIVQFQDFAAHRLWRGKRLAFKGGHARESLSIAYLGDEVRCQLLRPHLRRDPFGLPRPHADRPHHHEHLGG